MTVARINISLATVAWPSDSRVPDASVELPMYMQCQVGGRLRWKYRGGSKPYRLACLTSSATGSTADWLLLASITTVTKINN